MTPATLPIADHRPDRGRGLGAAESRRRAAARRAAWRSASRPRSRAGGSPSPSATPKAKAPAARPQSAATAARLRRLSSSPSEPEPSLRPDGSPDHLRRGAGARRADRPRGDRRAGRARLAGAPGELRRLDRHVLAGQRQVGRLRRGLRLLRPVALRRGRHADARDDGAGADPRARQGGRGRRRPPLLHGHPGPGPLEARLREDPRGRPAGRRADQPEALRLDRPHVRRARQAAARGAGSSASTTTSSRRAPTTRRSRPRSATRAGCARSRRSRRRASRPASAASSTSASRPRQRVEMAFELSEINPTSVPINLLNPRERDQVRRPPADGPLGGRQVGGDLPPDHPRRPLPPLRRAGSRTSASCSRWRSRPGSTA